MTSRRKELDVRLRSRPDLHSKLTKSARASGLSLNAEIIRRLSASFDSEQLLAVVRAAIVEGIAKATRGADR